MRPMTARTAGRSSMRARHARRRGVASVNGAFLLAVELRHEKGNVRIGEGAREIVAAKLSLHFRVVSRCLVARINRHGGHGRVLKTEEARDVHGDDVVGLQLQEARLGASCRLRRP